MTVGRWHWGVGATRGWWTTAARLLAFVLALVLAAPDLGLAADMTGTPGRHASVADAPVLTVDAEHPASGSTDLGPACHVHCGCHPVIRTEGGAFVTRPDTGRRIASAVAGPLAPVWSDRLSRPPRA
ncbi:hypothetical protein ACFQFG_11415 [Methylobacterium persicinum]|jgi:hypothetical protein|uniref:DUF2946 domain-containing protein n=1 Tax=Methylobacterium persicinum TaxID=374426 RepID=A0ABU0HHR5_9HYPH|nr:hypothetical protein [Methylobacterium persicinum]GJE39111.1 hypothetical protein KHHGKMAE_3190 [Methylobacterium persicinum]